MESSVFRLLLGTMFIYFQVCASKEQVTYTKKKHFGEMSVVSNITMSSAFILATWTGAPVRFQDNNVHLHIELVAECVSVGDKFSCNCSDGYVWTNPACYNYSCCSESTCTVDVTHLTPLCIPKLSTPVILTVNAKSPLTRSQKQKVVTALGGLNGIALSNLSSGEVEFKAALSVRLYVPELQKILATLNHNLSAVLQATTQGMVVMEAPNTTANYLSNPEWRCLLEESSERSGFTLIQSAESSSELGNGSVAHLTTCNQGNYASCLQLKLREVTGIWSGQYQCGFTVGSITHQAQSNMTVATMPDDIIVMHDPPSADCSDSNRTTLHFDVSITESQADYQVSWSYSASEKGTAIKSTNTSDGYTTYKFSVLWVCSPESVKEQYVNVTFENSLRDTKQEKTIIPVIYAGGKFCLEEDKDGYKWPKTPDGATVVTRSCPEGRVGKKSRKCDGKTWLPVLSECVNEELSKVVNLADKALKGLGLSQTGVEDIFSNLENATTDEKSNHIADVSAGISVLHKMSQVSATFPISEDALPHMVGAASNMLSKNWTVESTFLHQLSADYLHSVEDLVKNIDIYGSKDLNSENLEFKSCSSADCSVTVFGVSVNLTSGNGSVKTFAARNLMKNLKNDYGESNPVLLSATLTDSHASNLTIRLNFPKEAYTNDEPHCVFWNTSAGDWSEEGCLLISHDENGTLCECDHLTPFSVLMSKSKSKSKEANHFLETVTTVGLGISVCCLAVFLVVEALVWPAVVRSNLSLYRHTCMVNIGTFLLLADVSFLASAHVEALSDGWCLALTVCKHLFFLAMFCWMMCLSLMLVHQLVFVFDPLRKRVFMLVSGFIGYVCPLATVGGSYFSDKSAYFDRKHCWLTYERVLVGSIHAFLIPVGIIIITNIFAMAVVILSLLKSSAADGTKDDKDTLKGIMKVIVLLMPVFGVTWVFGFISFILGKGLMHTIAEYAFTILNSLQGLFILLEGVFAEKKVRMELLRIVTPKTKRNEDSMKTSTTKAK